MNREKNKIEKNTFLLILFYCLTSINLILAQHASSPFNIKPGLFDHSQSNTMGLTFLEDSKTFTIFSPTDSTDKYSNGAVLISFKGYLYAQWQSSAQDEDAEDTWVAYSRSCDSKNWTNPMTLAQKWEEGIFTSGGWWTDGEILVAYINVWPSHLNPRGGYTEYMISTDGITWSERKPLLTISGERVNGIFEQDPHLLSNGRIISAVHEQPGLIVSPYYTDDPTGIGGWTKGKMKNLPFEGTVSRELEPSIFCQSNGNLVMIFRDQASSFRKLASVSKDNGVTWSIPVLTDMSDSRSKQCAGNLPDGTAFMINNPTSNKNRFPLVITLSKNGVQFDKAYLLRAAGNNLQPLRYKGRFKNPGYHYPKAIIWNNFLYVSYTTNKEDVEITQISLKSLKY